MDTIYTVVVMRGAAESLAMTEGFRKPFSGAGARRFACSYANRRVTSHGGAHAAVVFEGTYERPLGRIIASPESKERKAFLKTIAGAHRTKSARAERARAAAR